MKRKHIRRRLSSSSEEDQPVKKVRSTIPPPPPSCSFKSNPSVKKGQGPSKKEARKKDKAEVMDCLKAAREAAASKMSKSPRKLGSPWKVTPLTSEPVITTPQVKSQSTNAAEHSKQSRSHPHTQNAEDYIDINNLLSTETDELDCVQNTPVNGNNDVSQLSFEKVSIYKTFRDLPNDTSFTCSPASALSIRTSLNHAPVVRPGIHDDNICSNPNTSLSQAFKISEDLSQQHQEPLKSISSSGQFHIRSHVDGRPWLFPAAQKSQEARLEAVEAALMSLEVLSREISAKIDSVLMNVGRVLRSLLLNEKRISKPPGMPKLLLESKEPLNKFEELLGASDANLSAVCDYKSNYVRTSVVNPERESATGVLRHLLTNNLAQLMNIEGGNKKMGFRCLNLHKIFQGTLQTAFPQSDLKTAEDALHEDALHEDAKWRKQSPLVFENSIPSVV